MNKSNNPRSAGRNQPQQRSSRPRPRNAPAPRPAVLVRRPRPNRSSLPSAEEAFGGMTLAPAAMNSVRSQRQPKTISGLRSKTFEHTEYISDVLGMEAFAVTQSFALNPGVAATFPWLSTQALGWEQYRFKRLEFHFLDDTGSSTAGNVMLVPDYDAADPAPVTKQAASTYQDVKRAAPWKSFTATLDPPSLSPMGPRKYIRYGALASNLDIKTYDAGNLFVGVSGASADSQYWGELWVSYEVEFFVPQTVTQSPTGPPLSQILSAHSSTPSTGNLLPSPTVQSGTLGVSVSGNVITFPAPGVYGLNYMVRDTGFAATYAIAGPTVTSGTLVGTAYGGYGYSISEDDTAYLCTCALIVNITASGGTVTLPLTVTGTASIPTSYLLVDLLPNATA